MGTVNIKVSDMHTLEIVNNCFNQRYEDPFVEVADQVACNVMEKHRVTLQRYIYCICCHKGCRMQDD